jgi:hypothetical protein
MILYREYIFMFIFVLRFAYLEQFNWNKTDACDLCLSVSSRSLDAIASEPVATSDAR